MNPRRRVRARVVEADLKWLRWVLNWATKWRIQRGYLLSENPVRGFEIPAERNPLQPVATHDRYDAIRAVSDDVSMQVSRGGARKTVRTYLSELLSLANGTGRRLSAICALRYEDLRLEQAPHGAICWPADTDKPVSRHLADKWLRKAERKAGLEPQAGSLWHAYRRKWATERKHLPATDVAAAGGWAGPETMQRSYQHPDQATMLNVVLDAAELREAR